MSIHPAFPGRNRIVMPSASSNLRSVTTIAPLRVSFVGGGTDIASYYTCHGGAVVSATVDQYVYVTVKRHSPLFAENYRLSYSKTEHVAHVDDIENDIIRECLRLIDIDPPLLISTASDLPASSGLGLVEQLRSRSALCPACLQGRGGLRRSVGRGGLPHRDRRPQAPDR